MAVERTARKHLNRHHRIVFATILASLCANFLYPGEVFFQSKYLLIFTSIFACFIVLAEQLKSGSVTASTRVLAGPFLPILILLPSALITVNASRSQEVFWLFFSYACLFFAVRMLEIDEGSVVWSILALSFMMLLIELYSFYQYFFGLSNLRKLVLNSTELDESFRSGLLARIGSKRVYANFSLPNTLAGFLTTILPLQFFLLCRSLCLRKSSAAEQDRFLTSFFKHRWVMWAFVAQISLSFICLALTQSFGGWVCFLGSSPVIALWFSHKRIPVKRITILIVVAFLFAGLWIAWLNHRRGFSLWNLKAAENPIALRWIGFTTAIQIFRDFPLTGVGLGNYGTVNPMYQTASKNVTQYAHNSFFQLLSETGLLSVTLVLIASVIMTRALWPFVKRRGWQGNRPFSLRLCVAASLVAWSIHNLLDINLYFPSVGSLGIFLMALLTKSLGVSDPNSGQEKLETGQGEPRCGWPADWEGRQDPLVQRKTRAKLLSALLLMTFSVITLLVARGYLAKVMFSLAIEHLNNSDLKKATQYIEIALRASGTNPGIIILRGKIESLNASAKGKKGPEALIPLRQAYERGTRLDPLNASYHYELSRILEALGEKGLASQARLKASSLFPSEIKLRGEPLLERE